MSSSHRHSRVEVNNVDRDDGRSWLCSACNLPIFATPFVGGGATPTSLVLHDECSDLPEELKHSELHREKPMFLADNEQSATCSQCSQKCGSKMYQCPDPDCGLILDVACALAIKILHWSHPHRLQPVRGCNLSICGICGATHEAGAEGTSYFCSVCGFWIHPECVALASVIEHEKHEHPLVLYYDIQATFGVEDSTRSSIVYALIVDSSIRPLKNERCLCGICGNDVARRSGIYSCIKCLDYVIHVKCATSHPQSFKSVSIGEARFPNLVRLPMKDEHQSFVRYVGSQVNDPFNPSALNVHMFMSHGNYQFPFNYQGEITRSVDNDDQDPSHHRVRVCDACNKIINTSDDQLCGCPMCSNFFVHDYCNNSLPSALSSIPAHTQDHKFMFFARVKKSFICSHCRCEYIGAFYMCQHEQCTNEMFQLDVSCALMLGFITHDVHSAAHFMRLTSSSSNRDRVICDCCCRSLGNLFYECRTCPNFALHTWCAMLPKTVTHKFDKHPLILTTTSTSTAAAAEMMMICEICENGMESDKAWYYSCSECDQSFHVDCIPCLDLTYKFKSIADSDPSVSVPTRLIRGLTLRGHSDDYKFKSIADSNPRVRVPTRLIRGLTLRGHSDDYCADVADEYDEYDILLPYS